MPEARMPTHVWGIVAISGCVLCHMAHTWVHSLQQPCLPKASNYLPHLAPPRLCPPCLQLGRPMPTPRGDVMCTSFSISEVEHYVAVGGYYDPANAGPAGAFR